MSISAFVVFSYALLGAVCAQEICRCEAEFERFYGKRRLRESPTSRFLHSYHYNYQNAYINNQGYYVVEDVVILPRESNHCAKEAEGQPLYSQDVAVNNFKNIFGSGRRHLADQTAEYFGNEIDSRAAREVRGTQRGKRSSSKDYYYDYGGEGMVSISPSSDNCP